MMNEKAFRLDFFLALAALVMSIITTGALVYQTRVIHDQYAISLWPYLDVVTTNGWEQGSGIQVDVRNDGFGPALIHSAQLSVDGHAIPGWKQYGDILLADPIYKAAPRKNQAVHSSAGSVDGSTIVRSGQVYTILQVHLAQAIPQRLFSKHQIALDFCYCSLNNSCWTLHSTPGRSHGERPTPIADCTSDAEID